MYLHMNETTFRNIVIKPADFCVTYLLLIVIFK